MESITARLADFIVNVDRPSVPDAVATDAVYRVMDSVGLGIAASRSELAAIVTRVGASAGGLAEASVFSSESKLPVGPASLVNGSLIHAYDFDDMHDVAMVHISSVTVPTMLALAESRGATGEEALLALIAGAEVGLRIGAAAPHAFIGRGWHGTSVCGTFASAAVACKLLDLDRQQILDALGIAGSLASGIMQGLVEGAWVKRVQPGMACQSGILAALLARDGLSGPASVLEGPAGLYETFLRGGEYDVDAVADGLESQWLLPATSYKRYPAGAWTQASMDSAADLVESNRLELADIERIECVLPPQAIPVVCEPRERVLNPLNGYQAAFSLPFSVALRLALKRATIDDYRDNVVKNRTILELASRVQCQSDPGMTPQGFPSKVTVITRGGRCYVADTRYQRGSSLNPMSAPDHRNKFMSNTTQLLNGGNASLLLDRIENLWSDNRAFTEGSLWAVV